jgi:hypothetical protein
MDWTLSGHYLGAECILTYIRRDLIIIFTAKNSTDWQASRGLAETSS